MATIISWTWFFTYFIIKFQVSSNSYFGDIARGPTRNPQPLGFQKSWAQVGLKEYFEKVREMIIFVYFWKSTKKPGVFIIYDYTLTTRILKTYALHISYFLHRSLQFSGKVIKNVVVQR